MIAQLRTNGWMAAIVFMALAVAVAGNQDATPPRLREGRVATDIPRAFGGGEVVLELTVDPGGSVSQIARIRVTPPYLEFAVKTVGGWRFTAATTMIDGRLTPVPSSVLVIAIFRPPLVYAGPVPGPPPRVIGRLSARVPGVESIVLPAYPPRATGDGVVVVEIEMNRAAESRSYRIVGPPSGFDDAALDAVRSWRFVRPQASGIAEPVFAYAVIGFRAPLTPPASP